MESELTKAVDSIIKAGWDMRSGQVIVVLANSDLADTVGVAHFPSIPAASRVIGIARVHNVCLPHSSGVAA